MTKSSPSELLDAAQFYAELGFFVFPCEVNGKRPLTPNGFYDASTDPEVIAAWWTKTPDANIGIRAEGLLVLDVDGQDNQWPGLERERELSYAPLSMTPGGGFHYVLQQPSGRAWGNSVSRLGPMVDTRGNGGYFIAPPSQIDGKCYQWAETRGLEIQASKLRYPPKWLVTELDNLASKPKEAVALDGNPIPSGHRNDTLARLAGGMRQKGMSQAEIQAALIQVNIDRCSPQLSSREVKRIALSIARYEPDQVAVALAENHFGQMVDAIQDEPLEAESSPDPGLLPVELLRVPGFISEVMDFTLATAPYPNQAMAFAGALALQAALAGRKVCGPGGIQPNLYLLALAYSGAGKERPRQVNGEILSRVGASRMLASRFASGEGLEDSLLVEPCMLFQTDEIDSLLQSIGKARDVRFESIMASLLTLYSASKSMFHTRSKAGKPGVAVDKPCLVLLGTATPDHYYKALSERMLDNGFLARMLIIESGKRGKGRMANNAALPDSLLKTAKYWVELIPGAGNLANQHPTPAEVPTDSAALAALEESMHEFDAEYSAAETSESSSSMSIWARAQEHVTKLALIYAVSESSKAPAITETAVSWAKAIVGHQTRRMLAMVKGHVAENQFAALCQRVTAKLSKAPKCQMAHSRLLKALNLKTKDFEQLMGTMAQRGDVVITKEDSQGKAGRPGTFYSLRTNSFRVS